jgi:hypothetical protein
MGDNMKSIIDENGLSAWTGLKNSVRIGAFMKTIMNV